MRKLLLALLLLASPAWAQTSVKQSGSVTPGHLPYWVTNGTIGDAGVATNGKLTAVGVMANGPGICQNSAPVTGPYQEFCIGTTSAGASWTLGAHGGAAPGTLTAVINGSSYQFPFTPPATAVQGPNPTTAAHVACWNNGVGTLLSDCATNVPTSNYVLTGASASTMTWKTGTSWFDSAYCNTVGYIIVRFSGAWTCSQTIPLNPVWWGADPTGSADSATAINDAIDAAQDSPTSSGTVELPCGFFKIGSKITLVAGVNLIGCGTQDWAELNVVGTWLTWSGSLHGTMIDFGNVYTGRVGNFTMNGNSLASVALQIGAPQTCVLDPITIVNTTTGGSPYDYAVIWTTDGQVIPGSSDQIPGGGGHCVINNLSIESDNGGMLLRGTIDGGVQTAAVTDMIFNNLDVNPGANTIGVNIQQASDTIQWNFGLLNSYGTGTAIRIGETTVAAGSAVYGHSFFSTAINPAESGSTGLDVRNTPVGTSNYGFGAFIGGGPGGSISYTTSAGATQGIFKNFETWGIETPSTPSPGSSPWTYTNTSIYTQEVRLAGGTVSSVLYRRQGANTAAISTATGGGYTVDPGDALVITYTGGLVATAIPH